MAHERLKYRVVGIRGDKPVGYTAPTTFEVECHSLEFTSEGSLLFMLLLEERGKNDENMDGEPMYVPRPALILASGRWFEVEEIKDGKPLSEHPDPIIVEKP